MGDFNRIPKFLARYRVHEDSQSYTEPSVDKAEECVRVMNQYYTNDKIPDDIMELESKAKSTAHLIAARFHLRAGRYMCTYRNLKRAWDWHASSIFSLRMIRLLGNGLLFRVRRLILGKKRERV